MYSYKNFPVFIAQDSYTATRALLKERRGIFRAFLLLFAPTGKEVSKEDHRFSTVRSVHAPVQLV